jgi:predicted metal-dependent phosphoesterase TrpH
MDHPINIERAQNLQQATVSAHCAQDAVIQGTAQHGAFRAYALNAFQKFKAAAKRIIVTKEVSVGLGAWGITWPG